MTASPQLEDGHVRIANELYDHILSFGFKGCQLKVVLAVLRKTYGYRKKEDDISASQIGEMCKIARQHVTTSLNTLALRNVITKRPGRYGSIIGIQKNHRLWVCDEQISTPAGSPEIGQVNNELDVQNSDTCTEIGHVQESDVTSPEIGQADSPEIGHTTDNVPKDNPQQTIPCAPQAERDLTDNPPAGKKQSRATTGINQVLQDRFNRFYKEYPRKKSRKAALNAFVKLNPDEQQLTAIIAGIERAMKSEQWRNPQYIPHPATWLNTEGWLDEIQTEYTEVERAVILAFNDALGEQLGTVAEDNFIEERAAAIRDFGTFFKKQGSRERYFPWVRDRTTLPPKVGFDYVISRLGYDKITGGQHDRKTS